MTIAETMLSEDRDGGVASRRLTSDSQLLENIFECS